MDEAEKLLKGKTHKTLHYLNTAWGEAKRKDDRKGKEEDKEKEEEEEEDRFTQCKIKYILFIFN